jgi:hypothetical protein
VLAVFLMEFTFLAMIRNKLQQVESGKGLSSPDTELEQPLMGSVLDTAPDGDEDDPEL